MTAILIFVGVISGVYGSHSNARSVESSSHHINGTWLQAGEPERLLNFFEDGNAFATDDEGGIYQGRWENVNENVVNATFAMIVPNPGVMGQGFDGAVLVTDDGRLFANDLSTPAFRLEPGPDHANDIDLDDPEIRELLEAPAS